MNELHWLLRESNVYFTRVYGQSSLSWNSHGLGNVDEVNEVCVVLDKLFTRINTAEEARDRWFKYGNLVAYGRYLFNEPANLYVLYFTTEIRKLAT